MSFRDNQYLKPCKLLLLYLVYLRRFSQSLPPLLVFKALLVETDKSDAFKALLVENDKSDTFKALLVDTNTPKLTVNSKNTLFRHLIHCKRNSRLASRLTAQSRASLASLLTRLSASIVLSMLFALLIASIEQL